MRDCRLHLIEYHDSAHLINYLKTGLAFATTIVNLFVGIFDSNIPQYVPMSDAESGKENRE